MRLLRILLVKDLLRVRRRPAPILIQIGISLVIVSLIGLAFGGAGGGGGGMAPIKVGIVDEDDSLLLQVLESMTGNPEIAERFDIRFLDRETALELIEDDKLSAVLVFPKGMAERFFEGGDEPLEIELVKNPAQSVYPAIVEEGLEALITVLNAVLRSFRSDLLELADTLDEGLAEDAYLSNAIVFAGVWADALERLSALKDYLNPPLVWFENRTLAEEKSEEEAPEFNLFAYLYVGIGSTFVLMICNSLSSDLYREGRLGTLRRFASLREGTLIFVVEKALLVLAVALIVAVIMFFGTPFIFGFSWQGPWALSVLLFCFAVGSTGLTSFLASIAGKEKRADTLNVGIVIGIALLGGGMVQVEILPVFIRENITPYLPTAWFVSPARAMQTGASGVAWTGAALKLVALGVAGVLASSVLFQRRMLRNGGVG